LIRDLAWCRERLEEAVKTPGDRPRLHSDINLGNDKWDAFAAECGVSLLARDRTDLLVRKLVGQGITGFFYSTTQLVVNRAAQSHVALGDDFKRVIAAVLEWSAIRPLINACLPELTTEIKQWSERKAALEKRFVDASLMPTLPDLKKLNADARKELDDIHAKRLGVDEQLVSAALSWLRPDAVTPFLRSE
jgi:hypothetical protein